MAQKNHSKLFGNVRVAKALTVIAATGCVAALAACSSNEQTYRPAPRYNNGPAPTYTQPAPTATNPPAPTPAPKQAGGGSCGKGGKCG